MTKINQKQPSTRISPPVAKTTAPSAATKPEPVSDSLQLSRAAEQSSKPPSIKKTYEKFKTQVVTAQGYAKTGVQELSLAMKTGDWNRPVKTLVDPALDASVLGPDDAFQDKAPGKLAMLLTNRLGIGESYSLELDAGATVPLEEFLIPNAKIDQGGALKVSRVQKRDAEGNLLQEPKDAKGNPPTALMVELAVEGSVGGTYTGKVGFDGALQVGQWKGSLQAMAGAEAEGGVRGRAAFTYAFDPNNLQEMEAMRRLLSTTASSSAALAIPGLGPFLFQSPSLFTETFTTNLVSIEGEGGLYAQASVRGKIGAGISKNKNDSEGFLEGEGLKNKTKALLSKLGWEMRVAMMAAGVEASANYGLSQNLKTGERTVTVNMEGAVGANGRLPLFNVSNISVEGKRTLAFTYDKNNQLKAVQIQDEMSKEQFNKGLRGVMEDMRGRPFEQGLIALVGEKDTVQTTYNLSPAEFEKLDPKSLGEALLNRKKPESVEIASVHRDIFEFKAALNAHLGAQVGVRGGLQGVHEQEQELQ